jgi:hypothetical protein
VPNLNRRLKLVSVLLLTLGTIGSGAAIAAKKKTQQGPPPKPIPTDQSLGFYNNTRADMRASIKRLGVLPVRLPSMLDEREDGAKLVQDTAIRYLTQAGFEVVGPESYQAAYDRFNKQLGGIYDAKTGLLKRDAAAAVLSNARREYLAKNRLDGFVIVRVLPSVANYFSKYARWDGVQDRCDGELPDPVTRFLEASSSEGTVPALSVRLQIVNTQDRVVYARDGGIELTSYFTGVTFKRVPLDSLLKDSARIERAVRVVTVPLLHTPVQIRDGDDDPTINAMKVKLRDLPPQPESASDQRKSPLLVPRDQILSSVKRVALSPVGAYDFNVPEDVLKRLSDQVRAELEPLGWVVVDSPKAREVLLTKMMESQAFDPLTGKRDEARVTETRKSVFKNLGTDTPPDAIVWLNVVKTSALQKGGDVDWDGVEQNAFTRGPVIRKFWSGSAVPGAGTGGIAVSSLNVYISDAADTPLYQGRGGIEVLQSIKVTPRYTYGATAFDSENIDLAPSELFKDQSREKPAVHAALRDLVLTPEALDAELNPDPKAAQKAEKARKKKKA